MEGELDLSGLESAVAQQVTTEDSYLAFVKGLQDKLNTVLQGNSDAQAKINAVMNQVVQNSSNMVAAMEANNAAFKKEE